MNIYQTVSGSRRYLHGVRFNCKSMDTVELTVVTFCKAVGLTVPQDQLRVFAAAGKKKYILEWHGIHNYYCPVGPDDIRLFT